VKNCGSVRLQELRERPLRGDQRREEHRAEHQREPPARPGREPLAHEVDRDRRHEDQRWELERDEVRDRLVDGAELGLGGEALKQPQHRDHERGVERRERRRAPRPVRGPGQREQDDRHDQRHRAIRVGAVLVGAQRVLEDRGHREHEDLAADHEHREAEPRLGRPGRAVHRREHEQHAGGCDRQDPERQHHVRRAQDLDVQAIRAVPPVVERGRHDHRRGTPHPEERAERTLEAPHADRGGPELGAPAQRRREDEQRAGRPGDDPAGLDRDVRRGPERVAADRHVSRDVPVHADHDRRHRGQ
jgi:hypothetical protein